MKKCKIIREDSGLPVMHTGNRHIKGNPIEFSDEKEAEGWIGLQDSRFKLLKKRSPKFRIVCE